MKLSGRLEVNLQTIKIKHGNSAPQKIIGYSTVLVEKATTYIYIYINPLIKHVLLLNKLYNFDKLVRNEGPTFKNSNLLVSSGQKS